MTDRGTPGPPVSRLQVLVGSLCAVAAVLLLAALWTSATQVRPLGPALMLVAALTLLTDVTAIDTRIGRNVESYTWGDLPVVLGLALLPPDHLLLTSAIIAVVYICSRQPRIKVAFNVASYAIGLSLAAGVLHLAGNPDWHDPASFLGLLAAVTAFAVWNKLSTAAAIALSQGLPLHRVILNGAVLTLLVFAGNVGIAFGALFLARERPLLLLGVPVLMVAVAGLNRWYLRVVQDRAVWHHLGQAGRELTVLDERLLAEAALHRVVELLQADGAELRLHDGVADQVVRVRSGQDVESLRCGRTELSGDYLVTTRREHGGDGRSEETTVRVALPADEALGSLGVTFEAPVQLTRRERRLLATYASMLVVALQNARLHGRLQAQAEAHERAALHDGLTGLPNRTLLRQRVDTALLEGTPFALLLIDLDRFKPVNDTHGHEAGDIVLRSIGQRMQSAVRGGDLVARLGGDEFAVLLFDTDQLTATSHRLQSVAAQQVDIGSALVSVGASIGAALSPVDGTDFESLLRSADAGMYHQKSERRTAPEASRTTGAVRLVSLGESAVVLPREAHDSERSSRRG